MNITVDFAVEFRGITFRVDIRRFRFKGGYLIFNFMILPFDKKLFGFEHDAKELRGHLAMRWVVGLNTFWCFNAKRPCRPAILGRQDTLHPCK